MKTLILTVTLLTVLASLVRADVLLPRALEPVTSAVTRTEAGDRGAATGAPERLPLAAPVVPPSPPAGSAEPAGAVPGLDLLDAAAYRELAAPPMRTTALWRVMGFGLWRGFANMTLWPGELVRGFTYEFSSDREWYEAMGTAWLAGLGGGLSRLSAGVADIVTLGYFGDVRLARGYPDFVWQGDWVYRETLQPPTLHTADQPTTPGVPRRIVQPGTQAVTARATATRVRTVSPPPPPPRTATVADPTLPGGAPR